MPSSDPAPSAVASRSVPSPSPHTSASPSPSPAVASPQFPAQSTVVAVQDGLFDVALDLTVDPQVVASPETVRVRIETASSGPTYGFNDAETDFFIVCEPIADLRFDGAGGPSSVLLFDVDQHPEPGPITTYAGRTLTDADLPSGAIGLPATLAPVVPVTIEQDGCDSTWTSTNDLTFTVPADTPAGEYFVQPFATWMFRRFQPGETPQIYVYESGHFPTILVRSP